MLSFEKPIIEIEERIEDLKKIAISDESVLATIASLERRLIKVRAEIYKKLTPLQKMEVARHAGRPYTLDYVKRLFTDFQELHGDRFFGDDGAIVGGVSRFLDKEVVVVGHQKGRSAKENIARNFGMANPEGYRKAVRLFKMAEKFNRPIITFVDTAGAFPGIGAEERGQAEAIAKSLYTMSLLKVPVISVVIGEGGSGGALGIAVANRVLMLEHSTYSVISPEGCASILWKEKGEEEGNGEESRKNVEKAGLALKITAQDLMELDIIDEIVPEPAGGAHSNYDEAASFLERVLERHLNELLPLSPEALVNDRYNKFRRIGVYSE